MFGKACRRLGALGLRYDCADSLLGRLRFGVCLFAGVEVASTGSNIQYF